MSYNLRAKGSSLYGSYDGHGLCLPPLGFLLEPEAYGLCQTGPLFSQDTEASEGSGFTPIDTVDWAVELFCIYIYIILYIYIYIISLIFLHNMVQLFCLSLFNML